MWPHCGPISPTWGSRVANRSKQAGTAWESAIRDELRGMGYDVERLRTTGSLDEGDLVVKEGTAVCIIEAKATQRIDLSGFIEQAVTERDNYCKARGLDPATVLPVVIVKRRGKNTAEAFVVTRLRDFFQ